MKLIIKGERTLLSLADSEIIAICNSLNEVLNNGAFDPRDCETRIGIPHRSLMDVHRQMLAALGAPRDASSEVFEAWRDGASIQVRAISCFGDPADVSDDAFHDVIDKIIQAGDRD